VRLFVFGLGYSAQRYIDQHARSLASIVGTARSAGKTQGSDIGSTQTLLFSSDHVDADIGSHLADADLLLVSIPPDAQGDPVLRAFAPQIAASRVRRIVYLSSVGVYGDHQGGWIDETATVHGEGRRQYRIDAEAAWRDVAGDRTTILRLAGIYGPGRNALVNLKAGTARRIVKPDQVFNRIHVDDIARVIDAAFCHPQTGTWNVCDDEPAPPQDVVSFAATLMGITPPPEQDFATAEMSPIARSFYATNNRISNARLKQELSINLMFPTYREGLTSLWHASESL
jgi:nucleoside-diphosphate-sugar epimerase